MKLITTSIKKENLENLKNELLDFLPECIYQYGITNFSAWIDKFIQELTTTNYRDGFTIRDLITNELIGVSFVKLFPEQKISTFKISDRFRDLGLGTNLMRITLGLFQTNNRPLITVPESSHDLINFLIKFGFKFSGFIKYGEKLDFEFNGSSEDKIILSIKSIYSNYILLGDKKIEFRRKPIPKNINQVIINSTGEERSKIIGYFVPGYIIKDTPENLWKKFNSIGKIEKEKFNEYFNGIDFGYGIEIKEVIKLNTPILPSSIIPNFKSPQFYKFL